MTIHIKVVTYVPNCPHNCILEANSTRIGIKLPVDNMCYIRSSLPHATRQTSKMHCSNKEHTNTRKYTRIYATSIHLLWQPTLQHHGLLS